MGDVNVGRIIAELVMDRQMWAGSLSTGEKELVNFARTCEAIWTKAAGVMLKAAGALYEGFADVAKAGAALEFSLKKVNAIAGGGFRAFEKAAREMGQTTVYSAAEAADAMYNLASAGLSVEQITKTLKPAINLATGEAINLDKATYLLSTTMQQFGLDASQATRITDVFTRACDKSQLTAERLGEGMKFAGTVASGFGWTLEETTTALAQFVNLGLEGGLAGRHFAAAFQSLSDPSKEAIAKFKELGISVDDVNPYLHTFEEIVKRIAQSEFQVADATQIWERTSASNMASIVDQYRKGTADISGMLKDLEGSHGNAQRKADEMADTVDGVWKRITGATDELRLVLYDALKEDLRDVLQDVLKIVQELTANLRDSGPDVKAWIHDAAQGIRGILADVMGIVSQVHELVVFIRGYNMRMSQATYQAVPFGLGPLVAMVQSSEAAKGEAWRKRGERSDSGSEDAAANAEADEVEAGFAAFEAQEERAAAAAERLRKIAAAAAKQRVAEEKRYGDEVAKVLKKIEAEEVRFRDRLLVLDRKRGDEAGKAYEKDLDRIEKKLDAEEKAADTMADRSRRMMQDADKVAEQFLSGLDAKGAKLQERFRAFARGIRDDLYGNLSQAMSGVEVNWGRMIQGMKGNMFNDILKGGMSTGGTGTYGGLSHLFGKSAASWIGPIAAGFSLFKAIGSDKVRVDQSSQVETMKSAVAAARANIAQMLQQVNMGQLTLNADMLRQLTELQFSDPSLVTRKDDRGGIAGMAGGHNVYNIFANEGQINAQLAAYEALLKRVEGTSDFERAAKEPAFTGAGTFTINNFSTTIGVMVDSDKARDTLARDQARRMIAMGVVAPGVMGA